MDRLRSVLNASARLIYASRRTEHVTPAPPWSALASISRANRLQTGGAGLSMPPQTGAELPRRRVHECVGDWVAMESSVSLDGQSRRASFSAKDTRWSCIPLWQRLKHGTAYRHMSHHHHRWRHSNAISRLSCSWDRTFKPDIGLVLHVNFLTLLRVLEVNIDLRHVNHIRYYTVRYSRQV